MIPGQVLDVIALLDANRDLTTRNRKVTEL